MSDEYRSYALTRVAAPSIGLMVAGLLSVLMALFYVVWSVGGIALNGFNMATARGGEAEVVQAMGGWIICVTIAQILGYVLALLLGALCIFAGLRMRQLRSINLVYAGIGAAVAAPLLAIVTNTGSCLGCQCCGFVFSNVGTLPVLVVGLVMAIWTFIALNDDSVRAEFDWG